MEWRCPAVAISVVVFLILTSIIALHSVSGDQISRADTDEIKDIIFEDQILNKESKLIFRAAFGDIIPGNGHEEIATCSKNGRVSVTYGTDMTWTTELAHWSYINGNPNDPAEVYSIAVDDIYPEYEGDEIITVDMDYSVKVTRYNDGEWLTETIWQAEDWLYEVAVGDIITSIPGPEIVVVGEDQTANILSRNDDGWNRELLFRDNFAIDTCFIDDIDPDVPGNEILVAGIDRNVTLISGEPGSWVHRDIAFLGSPVIDVLTTDLDPEIPGNEIYASTFRGEVWRIDPTDEIFQKEIVHEEGAMAYGIEAGTIEGQNVISMGTWNNRVALLYYSDGYKIKETYREEYIILGTGIHDLDPYHKGNEIFALTGLGYLRMIYHDDPSWDVILPFNKTRMSVDESINVPFIVRFKGGYNDTAHISFDWENNGGAIPPQQITEPGVYYRNVRSSGGDFYFNGPGFSKTLEIEVVDDGKQVDFKYPLLNGSVGQDRQLNIDLIVESNTDLGGAFTFSSNLLPNGMTMFTEPLAIDALGEPLDVKAIFSVRAGVEAGKHEVFIVGSTGDGRNRAAGVAIDVFEASAKDFEIVIEDSPPIIKKGENTSLTIDLISKNGFNENITMSILEGISDLEIGFSLNVAKAPETILMNISVLENDGPYFITVLATSNGLVRSDTVRINTEPPRKGLVITYVGDPISIEKEEGSLTGTFNIILKPTNGILEDIVITTSGLPDGGSVDFNPVNLQRIPYEINVTVSITIPGNSTIDRFSLNFISENEDQIWTEEFDLTYPDTSSDSEDPPFILIIVIALIISVVILGIILFSRNSIPNPLNRPEEVEEDNGPPRQRRISEHHKHDQTDKRSDNLGRSLDRMGSRNR